MLLSARSAPSAPSLVLAESGDVDTIIRLIEDAADWIATRTGCGQWRVPWPSDQGRRDRITSAVERKETWLIRDGDANVGSVTLCLAGDPELWPDKETATYVHRLVVDRSYRGLGHRVLNWAAAQGYAMDRTADRVRLDAWSTNDDLHAYYKGIGFTHLRTVSTRTDTPSGALFEWHPPKEVLEQHHPALSGATRYSGTFPPTTGR